MGSIVSGITDAIGLTNHKAEEQAAANAANAAAQQAELGKEGLAMSKEQLEFQREQYNDWKDIYGTLQEQINDYYLRYDASDVIAQKLGQLDQQYGQQEKQLTKALAQRGLSGSGAEAQGLTQLALGEAAQKSNIRSSAADEAINRRMNFLGLGLGQGANMLGINAQVSNSGVNAAVNLAGQNAQIAGQQSTLQGKLGVANMKAMGDIVGLGGGMYAGYKGWL